MGIDAQMFVTTTSSVTEQDLVRWSYELGALFGSNKFILDKKREWHDVPQHALTFIDEYHQDGPTIKPNKDEKFIEVHIWTRYWGPGYERGDFPFLLLLAEWLESNIPEAKVYYGGDSSGVEAILWDSSTRQEYIKHFVGPNGNDYSHAFDLNEKTKHPFCDFCQHTMTQYMWSNGYLKGGFACQGCGSKLITEDGGKTFFEPKEEE